MEANIYNDDIYNDEDRDEPGPVFPELMRQLFPGWRSSSTSASSSTPSDTPDNVVDRDGFPRYITSITPEACQARRIWLTILEFKYEALKQERQSVEVSLDLAVAGLDRLVSRHNDLAWRIHEINGQLNRNDAEIGRLFSRLGHANSLELNRRSFRQIDLVRRRLRLMEEQEPLVVEQREARAEVWRLRDQETDVLVLEEWYKAAIKNLQVEVGIDICRIC